MFRKRTQPPTCSQDRAKEARLVDAEGRAESVYSKAEWLASIVLRRDDQNHWQQSVAQLFKGGAG